VCEWAAGIVMPPCLVTRHNLLEWQARSSEKTTKTEAVRKDDHRLTDDDSQDRRYSAHVPAKRMISMTQTFYSRPPRCWHAVAGVDYAR
jgi:hypothetical protein